MSTGKDTVEPVAATVVDDKETVQDNGIHPVNTKQSFDEIETGKPTDGANYEKIDKELAKYTAGAKIDISPEESVRLRKLIDRRVLAVMIGVYFLQAIDKGTMSFSAIMGLPADTGMILPNGKLSQDFSWLTTCIYIVILFVEYPQNYIIARVPVAKYLGFSIIAWGVRPNRMAVASSIGSIQWLTFYRSFWLATRHAETSRDSWSYGRSSDCSNRPASLPLSSSQPCGTSVKSRLRESRIGT
jgi:hypothetical protein